VSKNTEQNACSRRFLTNDEVLCG